MIQRAPRADARDQTTHATLPDGSRIVRHGVLPRAHPGSDNRRRVLSLAQAVELARNGTVHLGRYGGQTLDAAYRRATGPT